VRIDHCVGLVEIDESKALPLLDLDDGLFDSSQVSMEVVQKQLPSFVRQNWAQSTKL
jgi:hypothetical protein